MDAQIINSFIESVFYTLDTTASVKAIPGKPYLKDTPESTGVITGLLEMSGEISGTVSLTFTKKSILGIVSAMFGEEMNQINEEITDAVGEIGNMISGQVNTKMTEMAKDIKVKLSGVKEGKPHIIDHHKDKTILALPFKTTQGDLWIEVCY